MLVHETKQLQQQYICMKWLRKNKKFEICKKCNKEIKSQDFYGLAITEEDDLIPKEIFCSRKCQDYFLEKNKPTREKVKIERCPMYLECLEIDNLRNLCEKVKIIREDSGNLVIPILDTPFCNPASAGLIKSSLLLQKQAKDSSNAAFIQFAVTLLLSLIMLGLTYVNISILLAAK